MRQGFDEPLVDGLFDGRSDGQQAFDGVFEHVDGGFRLVAFGCEGVLAEVVEPGDGVAGERAGVDVNVEAEVLLGGPVHRREPGVVGRDLPHASVSGLDAPFEAFCGRQDRCAEGFEDGQFPPAFGEASDGRAPAISVFVTESALLVFDVDAVSAVAVLVGDLVLGFGHGRSREAISLL